MGGGGGGDGRHRGTHFRAGPAGRGVAFLAGKRSPVLVVVGPTTRRGAEGRWAGRGGGAEEVRSHRRAAGARQVGKGGWGERRCAARVPPPDSRLLRFEEARITQLGGGPPRGCAVRGGEERPRAQRVPELAPPLPAPPCNSEKRGKGCVWLAPCRAPDGSPPHGQLGLCGAQTAGGSRASHRGPPPAASAAVCVCPLPPVAVAESRHRNIPKLSLNTAGQFPHQSRHRDQDECEVFYANHNTSTSAVWLRDLQACLP